MKKRKTIGLALGSGGFRGFAHIGVIKSFKKHNIPIDYLSGSSIGAMVAAHYALFEDTGLLTEALTARPKENMFLFIDFSWAGGLISGQKLSAYLKKIFGNSEFINTKLPLRILATDLITGRPQVLSSGDLAEAVRASSSIPLVFKPVIQGDKLLVDGGISNPVPGDLLKELGADIVIGVNLYHQNEFIKKNFTMSKIVMRSIRIGLYNLAKAAYSNFNLVIEPDTSRFIVSSGLTKLFTKEITQQLIDIGEKETDRLMPQIKALLK